MIRTVHLVYPSGPAISCPDAIGRNLAERLRGTYEVVQHAWDDVRLARPGPNDALVGHAHPVPGTVFRRSAHLPGWKRVIALAPFTTDPRYVAFHEPVVRRCDLFLAITGPHWFRRVAGSPLAHWLPKMVHVDLAVDRRDFPRVKGRFAQANQRRFLYIGSTAGPKNVDYLSAIARRLPEAEIAWIGRGHRPIEGLRPLGYQDFRTDEARRIVAGFDFLLTVGDGDANPTTILEAMAWGLVPACSRESGYADEAGIVNVPLNDVAGAVRVLTELQQAREEDLYRMRATNDAALDQHFNWDRFAGQVVEAIECDRSPRLGHASAAKRARLFLRSVAGPTSPLHPQILWPVITARKRRSRAIAGADRP